MRPRCGGRRERRGPRAQVVGVIDAEAMPVLKRCSLAGHAELKTRNQLFSRHPLAADMLIDILVRRWQPGPRCMSSPGPLNKAPVTVQLDAAGAPLNTPLHSRGLNRAWY